MRLQEWIHKFTEGSGNRFLQVVLVFFIMLGLAVWYNAAAFKNLSSIEGMDAAQVGRNLAEGRGFTTQFVRPFSMRLLKQHRADKDAVLNAWHPDLANPPLYPLVLALAMKLNPFGWPDVRPETEGGRNFSVFAPDLWIAMVNQLLFFIAVWLVFRLGRRLFDDGVGWVSAAVFAGADLFWRFSASGQSTMLLVVLFLLLVEVLARIEPETKDGATRGTGWLMGMAVLAGALVGLAGLTRYGFAWVIFPVSIFLGSLPSPKRLGMAAVAVLAFMMVMAPWVTRNFMVSGTPFGTAGYAVLQNTALFSEHQLERSLNADFSLMTGGMLWHKLWAGLREIVEKDLPRLGGSWVSAFFLVGLLVPFRNTTLRRLRTFLVITLALMTAVQALGRTGLSVESPEVTTENLLVVVAPAVFLFGVSLFFMLLEQFGAAMPAFRLFAVGVFVGLASLPLLLSLLMPVPTAVAYPPYYPPYIQEKAAWIEEDGLLMSDFPWAVAWYGRRQSVWLSLKFREEPSIRWRNDFAAMNDNGKPIRALYLSARTLKTVETRVIQPWILREARGEEWEPHVGDWEAFVLVGAYLFREVPTGFPLRRPVFGLLPELFLAESERPAEKTIKAP